MSPIGLSLPLLSGVATATRRYTLTPDLARQLRAHALREFPRECCGLITSRATRVSQQQIISLSEAESRRNVLEALNVSDHPTKRFRVDSATLREASCHVESGGRIDAIYHSHTDGNLEFSSQDRADAAPGGVPLYPDAVYLVLGMWARPDGPPWVSMAGWAWDADGKDFKAVRVMVNVGLEAVAGPSTT